MKPSENARRRAEECIEDASRSSLNGDQEMSEAFLRDAEYYKMRAEELEAEGQ